MTLTPIANMSTYASSHNMERALGKLLRARTKHDAAGIKKWSEYLHMVREDEELSSSGRVSASATLVQRRRDKQAFAEASTRISNTETMKRAREYVRREKRKAAKKQKVLAKKEAEAVENDLLVKERERLRDELRRMEDRRAFAGDVLEAEKRLKGADHKKLSESVLGFVHTLAKFKEHPKGKCDKIARWFRKLMFDLPVQKKIVLLLSMPFGPRMTEASLPFWFADQVRQHLFQTICECAVDAAAKRLDNGPKNVALLNGSIAELILTMSRGYHIAIHSMANLDLWYVTRYGRNGDTGHMPTKGFAGAVALIEHLDKVLPGPDEVSVVYRPIPGVRPDQIFAGDDFPIQSTAFVIKRVSDNAGKCRAFLSNILAYTRTTPLLLSDHVDVMRECGMIPEGWTRVSTEALKNA